MSVKAIKFTPECALYLVTFLTGLNARELPPAFEFGKKASKFTILSNSMLSQDDCPFREAKESTVTQWIKNLFECLELLDTHISAIEGSEKLDMEELRNNILLKSGETTTSLALIAAEWDVQKSLGIVVPAPANKSVAAITASTIKTATDFTNILVQMCSVRVTVAKYKAKEYKKFEMVQLDRKRKADAGDALVDPVVLDISSDDDCENNSNGESEEVEPTFEKEYKKGSKKAKRAKGSKPKSNKKRKPEGPVTLGQGQTAGGEKSVSLAQVLNRFVEADLKAATAAAPRIGDPMEIKAWEFLGMKESFTGDSEDLCNKTQNILLEQGAKDPTDLRLMGRKFLQQISADLKGVPARAVLKVRETCSQE